MGPPSSFFLCGVLTSRTTGMGHPCFTSRIVGPAAAVHFFCPTSIEDRAFRAEAESGEETTTHYCTGRLGQEDWRKEEEEEEERSPRRRETRKGMVAKLAFLVPNQKKLALFENFWHFIC